MENGISLADIAAVSRNENDGMFASGNGGMWIFALLILLLIGGGGFFGNNRGGYGFGEFNQYATSASQNEILLGQKFDSLAAKINSIGDGICSSTYALNNQIQTEGRAIQTQLCAINANIDNKFAALEKSQLEQRINEQAQLINHLQMNQAMCGIPRIDPYRWHVEPNTVVTAAAAGA